jgi:hypothetical protein
MEGRRNREEGRKKQEARSKKEEARSNEGRIFLPLIFYFFLFKRSW